ncbi:MAG TPA: hypothetical protein VKB86_01870 [Pyrinomonadaceae bacterium]|nr:hypothetical protein [Pyrinomonadaceae bacterium]
MLLRLFQTSKAICCAVTLVLLLQAGGLGCALGCARASSFANKQECHAASNPASATQTAATIYTDHACCHRSKGEPRETPSATPAETFYPVARMMQCCVLAGQTLLLAAKQSAAADKSSTLIQEKASTRLDVEFHVTPLTVQALLPDRGATYLRCCVLLI